MGGSPRRAVHLASCALMAKKVLLGYDDSEPSQRALARAVEEAQPDRGEVIVLVVFEMPLDPNAPRAYGTAGDGPPDYGPYVEPPEVMAIMAAAQHRLDEAGAKAEFFWAPGEPGQMIVDAAKARDADLIVLGHSHHSLLGRLFGADTAAEVQSHAGVPVIAVD